MFISDALAQATTHSAETMQSGAMVANLMPLFFILVIFYFMLIRPQQKKYQKHAEMVNGIKKGDRVLTGGGIIGSVAKVDADGFLHVEIASGVKVKVVRDTIVNVTSQGGESETGDKSLSNPHIVAKTANDNTTAKTANDN